MGTGTTRRSLRSAYCLVCALAAVLGPRSLSPAAPPGPLLRRLPELIRHAREREPEPSKSVLAVPSKSAITLTKKPVNLAADVCSLKFYAKNEASLRPYVMKGGEPETIDEKLRAA